MNDTYIIQAFKKITIDRFEIMNTLVHSDVPSRAFFDMDIREQMLLVNSTFPELQPKAFSTNSNTFSYNILSLNMIFNTSSLIFSRFIFLYTISEVRRLILRNNSIGNVLGESFNIEIGESISFQQNLFYHLSRRAFVRK